MWVSSAKARQMWSCGCGAAPVCTACGVTPYHYHGQCEDVQSLRARWLAWSTGGREVYKSLQKRLTRKTVTQNRALREALEIGSQAGDSQADVRGAGPAPFGARDKGRFACDSLAETTMAKFWRFLLLSPAAVAQQCVELLIIGDYGTRNHNQAAVAQGLAKLAGERQPQAVAAIGDNIYPDGAAFNPYTITRWWGDVYMPHAELQRNHDWWTDALYERAYTGCAANQEKGGHWQLPHFWYKMLGLTVDAFYIDTQIWKGSPIVDSKLGPGAREEQKQWLFSGLAESTADWRIVLGHHPVYSAGNHGVTEVLLSELDPKLRELGVPVYFAGHDHSKQVIYWEGMSYVISGSGGATARARSNQYPEGSLMHYFPDNGFVGLNLGSKRHTRGRYFHPS
eukprot:g33397.t1